jgi:hypothetical protein
LTGLEPSDKTLADLAFPSGCLLCEAGATQDSVSFTHVVAIVCFAPEDEHAESNNRCNQSDSADMPAVVFETAKQSVGASGFCVV